MSKPLDPMPRTLMQAHDALTKIRPRLEAPDSDWQRYYERSAAIYAEVAEIDRGHHHEALYWSARERRRAEARQEANASRALAM